MKNRRGQITRLMAMLACLAFAYGPASAQQISTQGEISLTNSGSPQGSRTLTFGVNPAATLGIDAELGEDAFPPFPPTAVFEARFVTNGGSELGEGSPADIRPSVSAGQKDEYKIKFQPGTNGLPLTITWDMNYLKSHYTKVSMTDPFGGVIMSVDMLAVATAQVSNPGLTELLITAEGPKDPNLGVEEEAASAEGSFRLQSTPNPVQGIATINYRLEASAGVTLSIVDLEGRVVADVIEGNVREAGSYQERVDVGSLPAGVYFVSLQAEGKLVRRPIVVVR